jgi:hypothetical protein
MGAKRVLLALTLFGISFGYVEAGVVIYLRQIYDPIRARLHPERAPAELFPLITRSQLAAEGESLTRLVVIELAREAATLIMLGSAALAVSINFRQWMAAFSLVFGFWDLAFYAFLKIAIDWPASLFTWDILFLLPAPWVGPVIAPAIVAFSMVIGGTMVLLLELGGAALRTTKWTWPGIWLGALIIIVAFMWDWRNIAAGNWPNPFNWLLFWLGELIGIAALLDALRRSARHSR